MIRAISFDLFDTLVDLRWENLPTDEHEGRRLPASARRMHERVLRAAAGLPLETFVEALIEGNRAFAESHYASDREVPTPLRFRDLLRRLGIEQDALADELTELHMGLLRGSVEPLPHHRDVLGALGRELRLGLCSNFSHTKTALAVLDDAGLRDAMVPDALVVSDSFGLRKPRKEIFETVIERLGVSASELLHVGDSLRADVAGAAPLGVRTVWITRRIPDVAKALAQHEGPAPDHTIADLSELPELVDSLA
jgi:HAD superfamily hydrolase (TIGR01509 family)